MNNEEIVAIKTVKESRDAWNFHTENTKGMICNEIFNLLNKMLFKKNVYNFLETK